MDRCALAQEAITSIYVPDSPLVFDIGVVAINSSPPHAVRENEEMRPPVESAFGRMLSASAWQLMVSLRDHRMRMAVLGDAGFDLLAHLVSSRCRPAI